MSTPRRSGRNFARSLPVQSDAKLGIASLIEHVRGSDAGYKWDLDALRQRVEEAWSNNRYKYPVEADRVKPQDVIRALTDRLTDDDLVITDASLSSGWAASRWRTRSCGRRLLSPRGVAGLGWGLPAAAGAAFAIRDSRRRGRVVCLAGDGGWGYSLAEIETLARFSVPLTSIVLNNNALAWTKHGAVGRFPDAWVSQDFTDVSWARAAEALGAWAVRVEDASRLGDAIDAALSQIDGPSVLEVLSSEFETPVVE